MIRESYDLDVICYFPHEDDDAGGSLKEIYENVKKALEKKYYVESKRSALRLRDKSPQAYKNDLRVDVIPGRFVDDKEADVFLYQAGGDKDRLKTNLQLHIDHVMKSGVRPAIRLLKLWRVRNSVQVKTFVLDLLVIDLLKGKKDQSLDRQLTHIWKQFKDAVDGLSVEDPANPTGNDLSSALSTGVRTQLSTVASSTLTTIEKIGWEPVFGKVEDEKVGAPAIIAAAAAVSRPTRPWSSKM